MADCLAAVITKFKRDLEVQRVLLSVLAPGSVLIRVDAATLCGTDTHRWLGNFGTPRPFIPGHETCGTIVEMRGELRDILGEPLKPGDRIISSYPTRAEGALSPRRPTERGVPATVHRTGQADPERAHREFQCAVALLTLDEGTSRNS